MKNYLMVDFGSTYTKLTAVDLEKEDIIATASHYTTVSTDITEGYHKALLKLYDQLGKKITFDKIIACSSAAGGLKMCAIGLVEELTVEAARRVCLGAGGKVDLVFSNKLTSLEVAQIIEKNIDIVLLAGGTDGGNSEVVLYNAEMLGIYGVDVPIIYAGNKACQDEIRLIFEKYRLKGYFCDNVMPKLNVLNIDSANEVIRKIFLENIIEAKGIKKIESEIDQVILPTPNAVLKAAQLLSEGYLDEAGLGDLMLIDIGGATTDVYSVGWGYPSKTDVVLKGLQEPFAKRTVEGDLGMRYSAEGVLQSMSNREIYQYQKEGIDIEYEAQKRRENVEFIATNDRDIEVDAIFAKKCVSVAVSRHVGHLEMVYTPQGTIYFQTGKNLVDVGHLIGTGGIIIKSPKASEILLSACYDRNNPLELRPASPVMMIDYDYILSAMGLLSLYEPLVALRIMKKRIKVIEEGAMKTNAIA
ncbi:MAG: MutL protein [Acholeplasmataceae bacterium]|nr:MutL protein [Acholeplasmataceae bacterium]